VNRAYIGLLLILAIVLPLCYLFTDAELSISGIIIIFIAVLMSYAIYWVSRAYSPFADVVIAKKGVGLRGIM